MRIYQNVFPTSQNAQSQNQLRQKLEITLNNLKYIGVKTKSLM
ncbi:14384_t:CDS:1, partial [Gigaspora margarita]